jgi:hypothetical protein
MTAADFWANGAPPPREPPADDVGLYGSLVAFQRHVCTILRAWLPLAPVAAQNRPETITYADAATIEANIQKALSGLGISIMVDLEQATKKSAMRNALMLQPFGFTISIIEHPITNRSASGSKMPCKLVAEHVALCLEGTPLGNGQCDVQGIQYLTDKDGLQHSVVNVTTAYLIKLPGL